MWTSACARPLLIGSLLLFACTEARSPAAPSSPVLAPTASATASQAPCHEEALQAAGDFVDRFNRRDLGGLTALFTVDARTLWIRRDEAVTADGFKEDGREMIGKMLGVRMAEGEVLAYRVNPDPSPRIAYANGTGQWFVSPRLDGVRGTLPDGTARALSAKFVYACDQHGIVQLVIAPIG